MEIANIFKGMAMGIAETIPGVSGGTIAFITGIYEKLLATITAFNPSLITTFKEEGFKGVWGKVNGNFLVLLLVGMMIGIVIGVFGVSYLLENHPILLSAFFFGLILASVLYIGKQTNWGIFEGFLLIGGAILAYYITIATPATGSESLPFVFAAGVIAISALMLPGLSGSFMLLLMGMYSIILPAVKATLKMDFSKIGVTIAFGLGCLVGVLTFARVLSWTFKNYKNATLALLTGFMLGSLNKVWPWQQVLATRINSHEEEVVSFSKSVLPTTFSNLEEFTHFYGTDPQLFACIGLIIVGFVSVLAMEKMGK